MGWTELISAFAVFTLIFMLDAYEPVRSRIVEKTGEKAFAWGHGIASVIAFFWVMHAAARAPYVFLWDQKAWQMHFAFVGMIISVEIFALSINKPNPFSFGADRARNFNIRRPGLVQWMRHPILVSMFIWCVAHLLPNGDLAHVLMFTFFAIFTMISVRVVDRRMQRQMGEKKWHALLKEVKKNRWDLLGMNPNSAINRLLIGMITYCVLVWAHSYLFGRLKLG